MPENGPFKITLNEKNIFKKKVNGKNEVNNFINLQKIMVCRYVNLVNLPRRKMLAFQRKYRQILKNKGII